MRQPRVKTDVTGSCYNARMSPRHAVLAQALQLPPEDRAEVARTLIESLDTPPDEDVEAAWRAEVERRLQEVERGTAQVDSWENVRERISTRLHQPKTRVLADAAGEVNSSASLT